MVTIHQGTYGRFVQMEVKLKTNIYLDDSDDRTILTEGEANQLGLARLEDLAGSNDGSELLANLSEKNISFT